MSVFADPSQGDSCNVPNCPYSRREGVHPDGSPYHGVFCTLHTEQLPNSVDGDSEIFENWVSQAISEHHEKGIAFKWIGPLYHPHTFKEEDFKVPFLIDGGHNHTQEVSYPSGVKFVFEDCNFEKDLEVKYISSISITKANLRSTPGPVSALKILDCPNFNIEGSVFKSINLPTLGNGAEQPGGNPLRQLGPGSVTFKGNKIKTGCHLELLDGFKLEGIQVEGEATIEVNFTKGFEFKNCQFGGLALSFTQTTPEAIQDKRKIFFNKVNHLGVPNQTWTFPPTTEAQVEYEFLYTDLSFAKLAGLDMAKVKITDCRWDSRGVPYDRVMGHEEKAKTVDGLRELLALYRALKKHYEEEHNFKQSGNFHYWEMEVWRQTLKLEAKSPALLERLYIWVRDLGWVVFEASLICIMTVISPKNAESLFNPGLLARWKNRNLRHFLFWYKTVGDYGESYPKLFGWLLLSVLVPGLIVFGLDYWGVSQLLASHLPAGVVAWGKVTFAPVIPGQIRDIKIHEISFLGKMILGLAFYLNLTLATLFVMAVRRKFRR